MKGARQRVIQELLRKHGQMTVRQLSEHFGVSEATIRRDLKQLAGTTGLERMHGGVTFSEDSEPPVIVRRRENAAAKMALARRAAEEIYDGATIFIAGGSTMACLAESLEDKSELTVITNAHNVASELAKAPGVSIIMTGGVLRKRDMSLIGPLAEQVLHQMPIEAAFMSVHGVRADAGLTTIFAPEASTMRVVVDVAPRLIVVAEAYKVGRTQPIALGPATAADLLVTDADPASDEVTRLAAVGVAMTHPTARVGAA